VRGCRGPPRGRQATAPSGPAGHHTANRRPRRAAALPPPSTTGPLQRAAASLLPLLPQRHAAVRKVAAAGAASGGRRAAARPEQRSRSGCSCPFLPLPSGQQADEDKVWEGITWCTRAAPLLHLHGGRRPEEIRWGGGRPSLGALEIVPAGLLLLCFFFPDQRSGLRRPAVRRCSSSTFPKDEVVAAPTRLQRRRS